MTDKQLIIRTDWRYFIWPISIGFLLSPAILGLAILVWTYFKFQKSTYSITDNEISSKSTGVSIPIDSIEKIAINNTKTTFGRSISDVILSGDNHTLILFGIEKGYVIKESIEQLMALKQEFKNSEARRTIVQVKQDPGSLERLNDLAGMLQEGLISYEDYLQECQKFEDKT